MPISTVRTKEAEQNKELIAIVRPAGDFELDFRYNAAETAVPQERRMKESLYREYTENADRMLLQFGMRPPDPSLSDSLRYLHRVASAFVEAITHDPELEKLRENAVAVPTQEAAAQLLKNAPYLIGSEYLTVSWLLGVWERLNHAFAEEMKGYQGTVSEFFVSHNPNLRVVGRIFFHLVENRQGEFPFGFLATYASGTTDQGKSKHQPLKNAWMEYENNNSKLLELLSTVHQAAAQSSFVADLVDSGEIFHPIGLTEEEAYTFLKEIPLYEQSGILCRIPNWWRSPSQSFQLQVRIGEKQPSYVNKESLIDFNAELLLGGETISPDEWRKLLNESEGLRFIKGKWVEVNHDKLKQMLEAYEKAEQFIGHADMNIVEAMRFQWGAQKALELSDETVALEVTNGEWLEGVVSHLMRPDQIEPAGSGEGFRAKLRTYQEEGLNWLCFMKSLRLGACLADDMGLGKTIQVIALLNHIRTERQEKALLVVPASLIGNWANEIEKFAPHLNYCILHPSQGKETAIEEESVFGQYDIFITTYGMLVRDSRLQKINWNTLVLDEAQAIKNPGTKQTQSVKHLKAEFKIAMTGTPIENRLSDLWSLFDFLNQGLLGSAQEFTSFIKRLKENETGYAKLKQVVRPFILRRLKTDKSIINDLPEKIEMKTYASLTKQQMILYQHHVDELKRKLEFIEEGIERKGLVLSSLMKFKQICNHPDQFLGRDGFAEEESGKFTCLRDICETIAEKRERVLIFTQFKEMTEALSFFLQEVFQHSGLVLHGGTSVKKRKEMVERFQGHDYVPFMVLSIKAGGVGLNLTAANHVVHFDRWWNPAVENQATDRAFRIGQEKNVIVHKLITKGTIEEKIDRMIEDKSKLSREIISDTQENWITEWSNEQLMDMLRLSV